MESDILQQILAELKEVKANQKQSDKRFDSIDARLESVDGRFDSIDGRFNSVDARLDTVDRRFEGIEARLGNIDARLETVDNRLDTVDSRLDEHYQLLKALEHAGEIHKAEIDKLTHEVARLSQQMNAMLKNLTETNRSLFSMYGEHEAEIRTIKRQLQEAAS